MSRSTARGDPPRSPLVCYCWSFTERQILDDVREHGHSTIRDYIRDQVKAGRCACEVKNPFGRCCLGDVARVLVRVIAADSA